MSIRCYAEQDGRGVVLSRIDSLARAERIRDFFISLGIAATVLETNGSASHRVRLDRLTLEIFNKIGPRVPPDVF